MKASLRDQKKKEGKNGNGIDSSWPAKRRWSSNSLPQAIYLLFFFSSSAFSASSFLCAFLFYSVTHVAVSQQQKSRATQDPTGRKTMRRTQVVLVLIDATSVRYNTFNLFSSGAKKLCPCLVCLLRCAVSCRREIHATSRDISFFLPLFAPKELQYSKRSTENRNGSLLHTLAAISSLLLLLPLNLLLTFQPSGT